MDIPLDQLTCSVPYICSLSKKVRLGLAILPGDGIKRAVIGTVEQFEADKALKASLKQKSKQGEKLVRQVDIRVQANGPVTFKLFVSWNWNLGLWHVFVEGGKETAFEDGEPNW